MNANYKKILFITLVWAIMSVLNPKQFIALSRAENEIGMGGARGGGKSHTGRVFMIEPNYIEHPEYAGLVVRVNYKDLLNWTEKARIMYKNVGGRIIGKPSMIKFPSGAYIILGHLRDKNSYMQYQGHEYQKMNFEELTQCPQLEWYLKLKTANRSTIPGLPAQIFSSFNPGGPGHIWVKERFVKHATFNTVYDDAIVNGKLVRRSRIFIPARVEDCPQIIDIDPGYVADLENLPEKLKQAWRYGNWDVFEGQFFDTFEEKVHVIKPFNIPDDWSHYRGLDWGHTNQAACLWAAVDFCGNVYIYREFYENRNVPKKLAEKILIRTSSSENILATYCGKDIWAIDQYGKGKYDEMETAHAIVQELERNGLYCTKANTDRVSGWNCIRQYLEHDKNLPPRIFIFENCKNLIRVFPGAVHDEIKVEDINKYGEFHVLDALRYLMMHVTQAHSIEQPKPIIKRYIDEIIRESGDKIKDWEEGV